ncbi:hypothetical protein [Micromonospora sp. 067-2]|uniref:hypothetical protein n=1 Tax=Micromonospora sp. 067-2 TaxID=2789270 RepID=UPI00397D8EA2
MRLSRIIMALTVGLAVVAVPTAAGAAQPQPQPTPTITGAPQPPPYSPQQASLTLSRTTIVLGEPVTLIGTNFGPNETVDIVVTVNPLASARLDGQSARRSDGSTVALAAVAFQRAAAFNLTATTDASGRFELTYRPETEGRFVFNATGRESGRTGTATLTVLRNAPQPPPLPVTGSSLDTPMKVGGGLVGAGALMLLLTLGWRRRQRFSGAAH